MKESIYIKKKIVNENEIKGMPSNKFMLALFFVLPIFTGNQDTVAEIVSLIMGLMLIYFFFTSDFGIIYPVLLFFYSYLVAPQNIVIYRVYSILYLLKSLFINVNFKKIYVLPLVLVLFYAVFAISYYNFRQTLSISFDIIFMFLFLSQEFKGDKLKRFFKFFCYSAVVSALFGLLKLSFFQSGYIFYEGEWLIVKRYIASFHDANYLGMFFNIAIFATIILNICKPKLKVLLLIIFYGALLGSLSLTGILCNVIFLSVYFLFTNRRYFKSFLIISGSVLLCIGIYFIALNVEIPLLSNVCKRISNKLIEVFSGDINSLTSNRVDIWTKSINYFASQDILKILFGGNIINNVIIVGFSVVSHQEYLDLLLNVGIIGFLIMMSVIIIILKRNMNMIKTKPEEGKFSLFLKLIWLFYALSITMFPSSFLYIFIFIL